MKLIDALPTKWPNRKSEMMRYFRQSELLKTDRKFERQSESDIQPLAESLRDGFQELHSIAKKESRSIRFQKSPELKTEKLEFKSEKSHQTDFYDVQVHVEKAAKGRLQVFVDSFAEAMASVRLKIHLESDSEFEINLMTRGAPLSLSYFEADLFVEDRVQVKAGTFAIGGAYSRQRWNIELRGVEANVENFGLSIPELDGQAEFFSKVTHFKESNISNQFVKSILAGTSAFTFDGHVHIRKNCIDANSEQLNKNLLLSEKAEVNSKPQLEIETDAVKATHGSTVGAMNPEEVFYLESRGLPKAKAKVWVAKAFAVETLSRVKDLEFKKKVEPALIHVLEKVTQDV